MYHYSSYLWVRPLDSKAQTLEELASLLTILDKKYGQNRTAESEALQRLRVTTEISGRPSGTSSKTPGCAKRHARSRAVHQQAPQMFVRAAKLEDKDLLNATTVRWFGIGNMLGSLRARRLTRWSGDALYAERTMIT